MKKIVLALAIVALLALGIWAALWLAAFASTAAVVRDTLSSLNMPSCVKRAMFWLALLPIAALLVRAIAPGRKRRLPAILTLVAVFVACWGVQATPGLVSALKRSLEAEREATEKARHESIATQRAEEQRRQAEGRQREIEALAELQREALALKEYLAAQAAEIALRAKEQEAERQRVAKIQRQNEQQFATTQAQLAAEAARLKETQESLRRSAEDSQRSSELQRREQERLSAERNRIAKERHELEARAKRQANEVAPRTYAGSYESHAETTTYYYWSPYKVRYYYPVRPQPVYRTYVYRPERQYSDDCDCH